MILCQRAHSHLNNRSVISIQNSLNPTSGCQTVLSGLKSSYKLMSLFQPVLFEFPWYLISSFFLSIRSYPFSFFSLYPGFLAFLIAALLPHVEPSQHFLSVLAYCSLNALRSQTVCAYPYSVRGVSCFP